MPMGAGTKLRKQPSPRTHNQPAQDQQTIGNAGLLALTHKQTRKSRWGRRETPNQQKTETEHEQHGALDRVRGVTVPLCCLARLRAVRVAAALGHQQHIFNTQSDTTGWGVVGVVATPAGPAPRSRQQQYNPVRVGTTAAS